MRHPAFSAVVLRLAFGAVAVNLISAHFATCARAEDAPPAVTAATSWTGFYVGGHGSLTRFLKPNPQNVDFDRNGGGVHAGWNYQQGDSIIGVEVDYTASVLSGTRIDDRGPPIGNVYREINIDDIASVRARFGGVIFKNGLIYGTLGYAVAAGSESIRVPNFKFQRSRSYDFGGIVAGAGLEYRFSPLLSARLEGLRYYLGEFGGRAELDADVVRLGFSLNFPPN